MKRRSLLAGAAIVIPQARPLAQPRGTLPVIGFLGSRSPDESTAVVDAFRQGLAEAGFVEGRNTSLVFRWAEGRYDALPALAAELVQQRVQVILAAGGPPAALAAKAATTSIPIVFSAAGDPVRLGLVASLGRPGGNITGMSTLTAPLVTKRIELLRELLPTATSLAYLANLANPTGVSEVAAARSAADTLGFRLHDLSASTEQDLDLAFDRARQLRVDAIAVAGEPFLDSMRLRVVELARRTARPASYAWREHVMAGGLMSYGHSLPDSYRRAGIYVARVLRGERVSDLPVMQPEKFELVINLRTASTLGLVIPPSLLARADELIE